MSLHGSRAGVVWEKFRPVKWSGANLLKLWVEKVRSVKKYSSALRKRFGYIFQIYISKYLISNTTNYWHNSNYWIKDFCMNNILYICSYHFNIQNSGLKNLVSIGHFRRISISMKLYVITFLSKVVLLYDYSLNIFQNCLSKTIKAIKLLHDVKLFSVKYFFFLIDHFCSSC